VSKWHVLGIALAVVLAAVSLFSHHTDAGMQIVTMIVAGILGNATARDARRATDHPSSDHR
jgi:hypothetical protein